MSDQGRAELDDLDLLRSVVRKAWTRRMNSMWSAWANDVLTEDEKAALERAGVVVDPGASNVRIEVRDA